MHAKWVTQMHFPNLHAIATDVAASTPDVTVAWTENYGRPSVRGAVHGFIQKFNVHFYTVMRAFKAARLMCPVTVQTLSPTPADVQQLRVFPFLDDDAVLNDLAVELPLYLTEAEGTRIVEDDFAVR